MAYSVAADEGSTLLVGTIPQADLLLSLIGFESCLFTSYCNFSMSARLICLATHVHLYHAIENAANQNAGKPLYI